jgi:hypothetical protein
MPSPRSDSSQERLRQKTFQILSRKSQSDSDSDDHATSTAEFIRRQVEKNYLYDSHSKFFAAQNSGKDTYGDIFAEL